MIKSLKNCKAREEMAEVPAVCGGKDLYNKRVLSQGGRSAEKRSVTDWWTVKVTALLR